MILIFLARSRDMKRLTPAWNDLVIIKPQHHGCDWDQSALVLRKSDPELGEGEGPLRCLTICGQCKFAHRVETIGRDLWGSQKMIWIPLPHCGIGISEKSQPLANNVRRA